MAFTVKSYSESSIAVDLYAPLGSSDTTIYVAPPVVGWVEGFGTNAGSALGTTGPFLISLTGGEGTEEHIKCASYSSDSTKTTIVVASSGRGQGQTSAVAHTTPAANNGLVYPIIGSQDVQEANQAVLNTIGRVTTAGDTIYATAANTFARLAIGAVGTVNTSTGTAPSWGRVSPVYATYSNTATFANFDFAVCSLHSGAGWTGTLPSATAGVIVVIQSTNFTAAQPLTISAGAAYIIGPGVPASTSTILLGTANAFVTLEADGTNWNVVGGAQDSGWVSVTNGSMSNSWVNNANATAYRLVGNRVTLRGGINNGASASTAWTLPAGYRPAQAVTEGPAVGAALGTVYAGQLDISTAGVVTFFYNAATGVSWSYDGFSFLTD